MTLVTALLLAASAFASPTLPGLGPIAIEAGTACVVPGGTCDATTTCCGHDNTCQDGTCKPYPRGEEGGDVKPDDDDAGDEGDGSERGPASLRHHFPALVSLAWLGAPEANCVNPGGSCNGSVPCCGQNNYCIDRVCRPYPAP